MREGVVLGVSSGKETRTPKSSFKRAHDIGFKFEHEIDESFWYFRTNGNKLFHFKLVDTHAWDGFVKAIRGALISTLSGLGLSNILPTVLSRMAITQRFMMPKTVSDFIVLRNGKFYAIECKSTQAGAVDMVLPKTIREHQDSFALDVSIEGNATYLYFINDSLNDKTYVLTTKGRLMAASAQMDMNYANLKFNEIEPFCACVLDRQPRGSRFKWRVLDALDDSD